MMMDKHCIQGYSSFTGNGPRKGWRTPLNIINDSEQRDSETGYGYFGARYMDHELMTMWLSVDPLADKYPSLTPFHYCRWNPLSRIDSDGKMDSLYLCGSDKMKKDALIFMQNQCGNLKLSEKDGFVSYTGEPKTEKEKYIANLISDKTIYVELWLKEDNILPNKKQINEGGGAYGGNYFIYDNKDSKEIEYVWATQYINVKQAKKVNQYGLVFWHEAAEAYESALLSREKKVESPTNTDSPDCNYRVAHKNASKLFPGDVIIENVQYHIYSL